jgi:hypothetical protein
MTATATGLNPIVLRSHPPSDASTIASATPKANM